MNYNKKAFLIVDIGSNSIVWILVNALDGSRLEDGDGRCEAQLKKGINAQGLLDEEHVRKLIETCALALTNARLVSKKAGLYLETHFFATQFLRLAANREDVVNAFESTLHEPLRILQSNDEAALELLAVKTAPVVVQNPNKPFLHMDMGGGSTEISFINANGRVAFSQSVNAGKIDFWRRYCDHLSDVFGDCRKVICAGLEVLKPEFAVLAGSSLTCYARYALRCNDQPYSSDLVESKRVPPDVDVDKDDEKALIGGLFVKQVSDLINVPIYTTTKGVRDGYMIRLLNQVNF